MNHSDIKQLLDEKYLEYCRSEFFVHTDPIQIPKMFERKEDIEIAGFFAASFAWGQRKIIINKSRELIQRMDNSPYDFVMNASEREFCRLDGFKHRTLNDYDCKYFVKSLANIYRNKKGMEKIFTDSWNLHKDMLAVLKDWYDIFALLPHEARVTRHIANVRKGSAAKRINMFLRWMIRQDIGGVDFGIWKNIPSSALLIPLDIHSGNISRELGLLTRKQNDISAVLELTNKLREFDPIDPIKYDYSLFGLGAFKELSLYKK